MKYIIKRSEIKLLERLIDSNDNYVDWGDTLLGGLTHNLIGSIRSKTDKSKIDLIADDLDRFLAGLALREFSKGESKPDPEVKGNANPPLLLGEGIKDLPPNIGGYPTEDVISVILLNQAKEYVKMLTTGISDENTKLKILGNLRETTMMLAKFGYDEEKVKELSNFSTDIADLERKKIKTSDTSIEAQDIEEEPLEVINKRKLYASNKYDTNITKLIGKNIAIVMIDKHYYLGRLVGNSIYYYLNGKEQSQNIAKSSVIDLDASKKGHVGLFNMIKKHNAFSIYNNVLDLCTDKNSTECQAATKIIERSRVSTLMASFIQHAIQDVNGEYLVESNRALTELLSPLKPLYTKYVIKESNIIDDFIVEMLLEDYNDSGKGYSDQAQDINDKDKEFTYRYVPIKYRHLIDNDITSIFGRIRREKQGYEGSLSDIHNNIGKTIVNKNQLKSALIYAYKNSKDISDNRILEFLERDIKGYNISEKQLMELNSKIKSYASPDNISGDDAKRLAKILSRAKNRMVAVKYFEEIRKKQRRYFDKLNSGRAVNRSAFTRWADRVESIVLYYKDIPTIPQKVREYILASTDKENIDDDYIKITKEMLGIQIKPNYHRINKETEIEGDKIKKEHISDSSDFRFVGIDTLVNRPEILSGAGIFLDFGRFNIVGIIIKQTKDKIYIKGQQELSIEELNKYMGRNSISIHGAYSKSIKSSTIFTLNDDLKDIEFKPIADTSVYFYEIDSGVLSQGNKYNVSRLNISKYRTKDITTPDFIIDLEKVLSDNDSIYRTNETLSSVGLLLGQDGKLISLKLDPTKTGEKRIYINDKTLKALAGIFAGKTPTIESIERYKESIKVVLELSKKFNKQQEVIANWINNYFSATKKKTDTQYNISSWIIANKLK